MIDIRPVRTLGHADHGWLSATHHFSFGGYRDRDRMGWGAIRVWNDDTIAAESGFPPHPHKDMEIITYVRTGAITHRDSLGSNGKTEAGDVQVMSAGSGITHSEVNNEKVETKLFQIWITPDETGAVPSWGQREFPRGEQSGSWKVVASGDPGKSGALPIRADARVIAATLRKGEVARYPANPDRHYYLVAPNGRILVNGVQAQPRDGAAITKEALIEVEALDDTEVVMVDAR